jgi:hypothetical protein
VCRANDLQRGWIFACRIAIYATQRELDGVLRLALEAFAPTGLRLAGQVGGEETPESRIPASSWSAVAWGGHQNRRTSLEAGCPNCMVYPARSQRSPGYSLH